METERVDLEKQVSRLKEAWGNWNNAVNNTGTKFELLNLLQKGPLEIDSYLSKFLQHLSSEFEVKKNTGLSSRTSFEMIESVIRSENIDLNLRDVDRFPKVCEFLATLQENVEISIPDKAQLQNCKNAPEVFEIEDDEDAEPVRENENARSTPNEALSSSNERKFPEEIESAVKNENGSISYANVENEAKSGEIKTQEKCNGNEQAQEFESSKTETLWSVIEKFSENSLENSIELKEGIDELSDSHEVTENDIEKENVEDGTTDQTVVPELTMECEVEYVENDDNSEIFVNEREGSTGQLGSTREASPQSRCDGDEKEPKLIVFVDIEADTRSLTDGKHCLPKTYVCGHCKVCKGARCNKCFSCGQFKLGQHSDVLQLIGGAIGKLQSCEVVCETVQECEAYKSLIKPHLESKYEMSASNPKPDEHLKSKIALTEPLCYPIPKDSAIYARVKVILAMQHVMESLREQQSTCYGSAKRPPVLNVQKEQKPSLKDYPKRRKGGRYSSSSDSDFDVEMAGNPTQNSNVRTRWSQRRRDTAKKKKSPFYKSLKEGSEDDSENEGNAEKEDEGNSSRGNEGDDDDDSSDSSAGYEDLLEPSMDDLKLMQETEINEAIRLGTLKLRTRLRPEMFSQTFQLKVGKFLADGGNMKALSERLDLTIDTLRSWRRQHEHKCVEDKQKKMQRKKQKTINRSRTSVKKAETNSSLSSKKSSMTKEILRQVINASFNPEQPSLVKLKPKPDSPVKADASSSSQPSKDCLPRKPISRFQYNTAVNKFVHKVTPQGHHLYPASAPKQPGSAPDRNKASAGFQKQASKNWTPVDMIYIYDKGASDVSEEESDFDDDVIPKPVMQDSLPFLCNDCREIFRGPLQLQQHLFICSKTH